ncbi:MAG: putative nucleotide-diphospho-sugar transferase [Leptolyngbyaceae cyanobacterium]
MRGYLYAAAGKKYVGEAVCSAQSLRTVDKSAHITLVTDHPFESDAFNQVIVQPTTAQTYKHGLLYKVQHLYNSSPYDETLFIDSDTYVCENIAPIFELLEFFDVAIAPDPTDVNRPKSPRSAQRIRALDLYNTGVILFRKNERNDELFNRWLRIYNDKLENATLGKENDQTSFIEAWLQSNSKIYVLSHAWNARTPFFFTLNQSVKIIHGRHKDYEVIKERLNKPHHSRHRCWLPVHQKCVMKKSGWLYHTKTLASQWKRRLLKILKGVGVT